jgi:hypothetical protein
MNLISAPVAQSNNGGHHQLASNAVNGIGFGESWDHCLHYTSSANPWFKVDLGSEVSVTEVRLYNRMDCCPERLHNVSIYLGNDPTSYSANALVAGSGTSSSDLDVPNVNGGNYLNVPIGRLGRYLWVARPGNSELTICELEVKSTPTPAVACPCLDGFEPIHGDTKRCELSHTAAPTFRPTRSPTAGYYCVAIPAPAYHCIEGPVIEGEDAFSTLDECVQECIEPTNPPTHAPTPHPCDDGTHGCDQQSTECVSRAEEERDTEDSYASFGSIAMYGSLSGGGGSGGLTQAFECLCLEGYIVSVFLLMLSSCAPLHMLCPLDPPPRPARPLPFAAMLFSLIVRPPQHHLLFGNNAPDKFTDRGSNQGYVYADSSAVTRAISFTYDCSNQSP